MSRWGFPKRPAYREHLVAVEPGGHILHCEEHGCPTGLPIVYLHGGPGGGIPRDMSRLFDPEVFRVVLFDQRGCGRSQCADRLASNTTEDLLRDIEAVRTSLDIDRWAVRLISLTCRVR